MERYTNPDRKHDMEELMKDCPRSRSGAECWLRLCDIEDILGDDYDLARLRELVEADREGLCIILQKVTNLKKGDRVWYVDKENGEIESGTVFLAAYKDGKLDSFSVDFDCGDFDEFLGSSLGRCFFGSKEAAEAALKGDKHGMGRCTLSASGRKENMS